MNAENFLTGFCDKKQKLDLLKYSGKSMKEKSIPSKIKSGIMLSRRDDCYKECRLRSHSSKGFKCSQCYLGLVQLILRKLNPEWNRVSCTTLYSMVFDEVASRHHDCVDRNNAMKQIFELICKRSCKI